MSVDVRENSCSSRPAPCSRITAPQIRRVERAGVCKQKDGSGAAPIGPRNFWVLRKNATKSSRTNMFNQGLESRFRAKSSKNFAFPFLNCKAA